MPTLEQLAPRPLRSQSPGRSFRAVQAQVVLATLFCYLFYYTGRQSFGFAIPGIEQDLGISKPILGWIATAMLWFYGLGQAIHGNLGDAVGGRRLMSLGAVLSCGLNWIVSFGQGIAGLAVPWSVNGYVQSMGWAPGGRVLSHWSLPRNRGQIFGCYMLAAGGGSVLVFVTSSLILDLGLDWRWLFRLPVLLMLLGGVVYYVLVRDRPEELGFEPLPDAASAAEAPRATFADTAWSRYQAVLRNRQFLLASVAIGFQSAARYGLLTWVPVHFLGKSWKDQPGGVWISLALPLGMAFGGVVSGWISDRLFGGNRGRVFGVLLGLAGVVALAAAALPSRIGYAAAAMFLLGFFAYGPQSVFWAVGLDLVGRDRAGTAVGIMDAFAYFFAGLATPMIGWLIDRHDNTFLVFPVVAVACFAGAATALLVRR